ncbi:hypothetical protein L3Q82_013242 [Scortum barcoo]|uniref:Uncharacterized protein n=1 Tax=Scortum barcoo TaxID=214431 RepID=A0ACB8W042_9TELE|nr:hypothetical protein L3Q82_013242 [Scortum barcoo]
MDLSLLPTPASEYDKKRAGARFTVRSANSPSYSLTRRPGDRKPRSFSEEERESTGEGHGTHSGTNGTSKEEDHTVTGYQAKTGSRSSVEGQCEVKETSSHKMSAKQNQNGTAVKTITEFSTDRSGSCNPASESRGRTEFRGFNPSSRSKSLDWRTGDRSPDWSKRADMFMLSTKGGGEVTGVEGVRGRVMSSVQSYNSAGTSSFVREGSPLSHISQTFDRVSKGHSLPSRMRSQFGPGSGFGGTSTSLGPKSGQSIVERIEKLYGSTERAAGGTFPRCFSSGEKSSLSPVQSRKSFTWTQKDTSRSESSLSLGTSRTRERLSMGHWQGQTQGRFSEEGGGNCERGMGEMGIGSLDRARSRYTVAAQVRSIRAAGGLTESPLSNIFLEEESSASLRDSSGLRERRASGTNGPLRVRTGLLEDHEKEKDDQAKARRGSITDEDVFESIPQKITMKTSERKRDMLSVPSAASVRNKINQFEALTQRSQGLATGQVLIPRRAFSVPTQLSSPHDGVKKSGSAKVIGGLRDKWEGLKEEDGAGKKTQEKVTAAGKKLGWSERSLSVDEAGLRLERKEREGNDDVKETESDNNCAEDFGKYSRLKSTLEIPLNGGAQRRPRNFYIDETDFSKRLSPEEATERPPSSQLSNFSDSSAGVQETAAIRVSSPVSDEDKTPTNTPNHSPLLSPTAQPEKATPTADSEKICSIFTQGAETHIQDSSPLPHPLATSSHSNLPDLISPDVSAAFPNRKKRVLDLNAWVAGSLTTKIKDWNDDDDYEDDDDESTQKDEDSNYDSDSGESSVTITSNMSQSDHRSFSVSLSDLCNLVGVEYESENDSEEWQSTGQRTASLSSDMSALSYVSVMPSEELERLLEDVRSLGDSTLQAYDDVQVVVLHKEVGVGLGFSLAGGVDQNNPFTVHKVFHSGVAAQEGSIREGDLVLSINGTTLAGYAHWEALRVLRRAKTRELGVVVLRKGGISSACKGGAQTNNAGPTQTQFTETGQRVCVHLEKNTRDLGFSLEGGVGSSLENRPLTVQKIFQGGPVDKVRPGDEIVEIGGVSMVGMRRLEAWTLIRKLPLGPVDVVLRRPLKYPET